MPDVTFEKMRELAATIRKRHGSYWFKFTCCGVRQDVEPPDVIHREAICEVCGGVYDFVKNGGGIRGAWMLGPPRMPREGF